jgi:hypothetical protein
MIVDNSNFRCPFISPEEAHSVLAVYPYAELSIPVAPQGFKKITRRDSQCLKPVDRVKLIKFSLCYSSLLLLPFGI